MSSSRKVLIEASAHSYVGYFRLDGQQIDRGYPLEERPEEPPTGSVYEREYVLLKDAVDEEGKLIERLNGFPLRAGPRKFLRGRVVTDQKEAMVLLLPSFLREMVEVFDIVVGMPMVVAVKHDDAEVGIQLQDGDIPPPEGASHYPVGESPEEQRMAEMVMEAVDDELADIRNDVKDGVYDDEEEAAVGGGHPVLPSGSDDDNPRAA